MSPLERKPGPLELGAAVLAPEPNEAWTISAQGERLVIQQTTTFVLPRPKPQQLKSPYFAA
jgi:hypothetical protein